MTRPIEGIAPRSAASNICGLRTGSPPSPHRPWSVPIDGVSCGPRVFGSGSPSWQAGREHSGV